LDQIRWLVTITVLRVEYRAEGVMPITASAEHPYRWVHMWCLITREAAEQ
jgi:hypothetical protein